MVWWSITVGVGPDVPVLRVFAGDTLSAGRSLEYIKIIIKTTGPNYSKLTTSSVNDSLKFQK